MNTSPDSDDDLSNICAGYIPLIARVLCGKSLSAASSESLENYLKQFTHREVDIKEWAKANTGTHYRIDQSELHTVQTGAAPKKDLAVVFVNGLTFAEVAVMRQLSKSPAFQFNITMFTTHLINGKSLVQSTV